jgi:Predicted metal-dependent protease of the PAD1/JAB1 superfamily
VNFAAPVLRLSVTQHERILGHCYAGLPDEACGLLAGPVTGSLDGREATGAVSEVYPAVNADASARTYTVDGRDYLRATRDAEARGDEIIGVWHSHTHTDPYPSPTDVSSAVDPMWVYVIVSLRDDIPMLRAYRIRDGVIAECQVVLESRSPV